MECHTCTITFIYGIQSVHEMSAAMNLEFVFSFNRIHCNYCHSANDRVFVLGWGIGWCCRPGLDGRGLRRMLQYATLQTGRFFHHEMPFQKCVWRFAAAASTFCSLTDRYLIDIIIPVVRHFYNKTLVCTFTVATLHHMNICYDYLPLNSIPLCAFYQGCPGYIN